MKNSMRDQLLRAGVASRKQAQKASTEQRKKKKQARKNRTAESKDTGAFAKKQAEKAARDRELNRRKQEEIERRAIAAQIRQLIEMNRLSCEGGSVCYHFADGRTVRKLYVTEEMHKQLACGRLSIVRLEQSYEVVPSVVADKIAERDDSVVVASNQPETRTEEDELYADFAVPEDLMW